MKAPEGLRISIEKLMLGITDNLDPYVGLKLTNLTIQVAELSYMMGHQDGNRDTIMSDCPTCPFKALT
ncbi:hypothetical protein [Candidatus Cyanaurora vandensis]|uniref:hypothetical protein n=1 Tax=Candidatus Cyanaurora vandensis TaxID=2714958 RepID=UPI0025803758|nr:hypothetical protein [Candidatus Cyanaurora vandensis]